MAIPIQYKRASEAAIASFDSEDIAEGTGIVEYFASNVTNTATISYYLTRDEPYADTIYTSANSADTTYTLELDLDFDVIFQLPRTIADATMYANIAVGIGSSGNDQANECYIIVKLRKHDGTSEIEIASSQSRTFQRASGEGDNPASDILSLSIATGGRTHLKKGDILRITMELWGKRVGGSANTADYAIGHDPKNRNDTRAAAAAAKIFEDAKDTTTKFWIPFVLDL